MLLSGETEVLVEEII